MMTGLDTNVVIRFVTQDDADQSRRANAVFALAAASGEKLYLGAIALCEVVWVLRSAYAEPKERVVEVLEALVGTPEVVIEDGDIVRRALADYARGPADFADYLLARRNDRAGCQTTLTFDGALQGHGNFTQA